MAENQPTLFDIEIWKPVLGYAGSYEVSSFGRVRSLPRLNAAHQRIKGRIMKPTPRRRRYLAVPLSSGGTVRKMSVHRLVLEAFAGPCPEGMEVDHIDNDPANNRLDNLRYLTPAQNMARQKLFGTSHADRVASGTDHQTSKDRCNRGHLLEFPNLVVSKAKRGRRACLACHRTDSRVRYHQEQKPYFQDISDSYYEAIMSPSNLPRPA